MNALPPDSIAVKWAPEETELRCDSSVTGPATFQAQPPAPQVHIWLLSDLILLLGAAPSFPGGPKETDGHWVTRRTCSGSLAEENQRLLLADPYAGQLLPSLLDSRALPIREQSLALLLQLAQAENGRLLIISHLDLVR